MIAHAIAQAVTERWPNLNVSGKFPPSDSTQEATIEIHYMLKPKNPRGFTQGTSLWVGTIHVQGEQIKLSVIQNKFCYENVLSDPLSLDELYTILATHIQDVHALIPAEWHDPQYPDEPTQLELMAEKNRAAANLQPTKLRVREWGN